MKRGTAAWILAGSLLAAGASFTACGDDDGGGDDPDDGGGGGGGGGGRDAATDSGNGGGRDAATDSGGSTTPDTSTSDGGAAVAAALASAGVDGTQARADIVFPLACAKGAECDTLEEGDTVASCTSGGLDGFRAGITSGDVPVACADALLDFLGCTVRLSCDMEGDDDCVDELATQNSLCGNLEDDAGT